MHRYRLTADGHFVGDGAPRAPEHELAE